MSAPASRGSRPDMMEPSSSRQEAIGLLAPALGEEKAREVVATAARALGVDGDEWTTAAMRSLFELVAKEPGLVGITARVVTRRIRLGGASPGFTDHGATPMPTPGAFGPTHAPAPPPPFTGAVPHAGPEVAATASKPWESVSDLLVQALGPQGARTAVEHAVHALGLGRTLTYGDALKVLEHIAREPGVTGIAARFAKTRLHLLSW